MYRFRLFNEISFSSLFYIGKNTLVTHTKKCVSVINKYLKETTLQYDENFIWRFLKMTLFGVWRLYNCHNFKTSGPIVIMFASFKMRDQCYVLRCENLKTAEGIHVTHFGRQGHILLWLAVGIVYHRLVQFECLSANSMISFCQFFVLFFWGGGWGGWGGGGWGGGGVKPRYSTVSQHHQSSLTERQSRHEVVDFPSQCFLLIRAYSFSRCLCLPSHRGCVLVRAFKSTRSRHATMHA